MYSKIITIITSIKVVGLIFLITHCLIYKQALDIKYVAIYLILFFTLSLILLPFVLVVDKIREMVSKKLPTDEKTRLTNFFYRSFITKPYKLLLIPGEDGFFFLPLLYIGITPLSVAIASGLFAAAHLGWASIQNCAYKFILYYIIVSFILPYGILHLVIGHLIVDSFVFIWVLVIKKREKNIV